MRHLAGTHVRMSTRSNGAISTASQTPERRTRAATGKAARTVPRGASRWTPKGVGQGLLDHLVSVRPGWVLFRTRFRGHRLGCPTSYVKSRPAPDLSCRSPGSLIGIHVASAGTCTPLRTRHPARRRQRIPSALQPRGLLRGRTRSRIAGHEHTCRPGRQSAVCYAEHETFDSPGVT